MAAVMALHAVRQARKHDVVVGWVGLWGGACAHVVCKTYILC